MSEGGGLNMFACPHRNPDMQPYKPIAALVEIL